MLHPRPAKTRVRKSVSAALTALLVLVFLPAAPPASRVAAQTAGDDTQNPNIPAVPPGQARPRAHPRPAARQPLGRDGDEQ
ncbi:MAG: hypothetical protein DMF66_15370 [Acidobacteria bacterium]|nr:MAG: hypothetical protein DMF66_15370 [Acidobacteriota bacterium]